MQEFKSFGEVVLVDAVPDVTDSGLSIAVNAMQTDGSVISSGVDGIKEGDKIHFIGTIGRLSDKIIVVDKKQIIALEI